MSSGWSASDAAAEIDPSQWIRASVPSGEPNRSALPVSASPSTSHQRPAAASPARRAGVGASAATPTKAGRQRDRAEQRRQHRHRPQQSRSRQQERHRRRGAASSRAVPWRSASGETSQAHRPITASSQPMRGSTAVAAAAIAAAASAENDGSGPRPSRHPSTRPPAELRRGRAL